MQKSGKRLPAKTVCVRGMGTEKNGLNLTAQAGKFANHLAVDGVQVINGQQMPSQAGLIAGNSQTKTALVEAGHGLQTPWNRAPLRD